MIIVLNLTTFYYYSIEAYCVIEWQTVALNWYLMHSVRYSNTVIITIAISVLPECTPQSQQVLRQRHNKR
jgi:hypothetical protein